MGATWEQVGFRIMRERHWDQGLGAGSWELTEVWREGPWVRTFGVLRTVPFFLTLVAVGL